MKIAYRFPVWFFTVLFLFNIILGSFVYFDGNLSSKKNILSPFPSFFKYNFNGSALASGYWKPNIIDKFEFKDKPLLSSKSIISYDLTTNKLLYGEDIDVPLPIASLTKIMTAIIVLENMKLDEEIKVSKKASKIGEDSMLLSENEILTVENLLYGLLLQSGNDTAIALSEGSPMGERVFLHSMNKKAEDLGLSSTRFTNPTGLEGDGHQYSTVRELLILTRYALQNPTFAKIVSTFEYEIPATKNHKQYHLFNETNLLTTYPGVKGVKTGYTDEAGMCLVSYLDYKDHKIIAVLLNSANRRAEMKTLLDYSLKSLGVTPPEHN